MVTIIDTNAGFFGPFLLGFSYFNLLLIFLISFVIIIIVIWSCCFFGGKKPPVNYSDIVNKYGGESV